MSKADPTPPDGLLLGPRRVSGPVPVADAPSKLEVAVAAAGAGLWEWWLDSGEMRFSDRCFTLLGYEPGELPARFDTFAELLHADDRNPILTRVTSEIAQGKLEYEYEFRLRERSGSHRWMLSRSRAVDTDDAGRASHIVGLILDISDRKQAEQDQRRLAEMYRALRATVRALADAPDVVTAFELVCSILVEHGGVDRAWVALLSDGQLGSPLALRDLGSATEPSPRERQVALTALENERPTVESVAAPGSEAPGSIAAFPLSQAGSVVGILGVAAERVEAFSDELKALLFDIAHALSGALDASRREHQRASAVAALGESETRLELALSAARQGTFDIELASGKMVVSREYAAMLGYDPARFSETLESLSRRIHPEDRERVLAAMRAHIDGATPEYREEFRVKHARDEWRHLLAVGSVLERDANGRAARMLGTHLDVSDRARAEAKHALLERQLRQAQKMEAMGRLAGGVAHDFNNLLSVILSYSTLATQSLPDDDPLKEDMEEVRKAGERAAALTRQLLAFSRQQVLEPRLVDLNELVTGLQKMLVRVLGEDIEFSTRLARDLDPITADPGQIEQVVMNLAVNARDAMSHGGRLLIETENVDVDGAENHVGVAPGRYVLLAVTDTGAGMDRETLGRLFEPFFTTKEPGKGTGLGLSTVFGIVRQSGGAILPYSELGRGATFKIYLPSAASDAARDRTPMSGLDLRTGSETILLVEDDDAVRGIARSILEKHGYTVLSARSAGDALLVSRERAVTIHLLLTDVIMPELNGPELASRLRAERPSLRVLCMSGYTAEAARQQGMLDADTAFLQKPITPDALLRKVREVLDA